MQSPTVRRASFNDADDVTVEVDRHSRDVDGLLGDITRDSMSAKPIVVDRQERLTLTTTEFNVQTRPHVNICNTTTITNWTVL